MAVAAALFFVGRVRCLRFCRGSQSFFPLVLADEALDEVRHGLVSAARLLLVITSLLRLALLTRKKAVLIARLQVLRPRPVRPLRVHPRLLRRVLLPLQLC